MYAFTSVKTCHEILHMCNTRYFKRHWQIYWGGRGYRLNIAKLMPIRRISMTKFNGDHSQIKTKTSENVTNIGLHLRQTSKTVQSLLKLEINSERRVVSVEIIDSQLPCAELQALVRMNCDCLGLSMYRPSIYIGPNFPRRIFRSRTIRCEKFGAGNSEL